MHHLSEPMMAHTTDPDLGSSAGAQSNFCRWSESSVSVRQLLPRRRPSRSFDQLQSVDDEFGALGVRRRPELGNWMPGTKYAPAERGMTKGVKTHKLLPAMPSLLLGHARCLTPVVRHSIATRPNPSPSDAHPKRPAQRASLIVMCSRPAGHEVSASETALEKARRRTCTGLTLLPP